MTSAAACSIVFEKKLATQDRPLFSLPRELCPLSLDESRVEIVRGWVTAQQAVQVEAASRRAGSCWLERPVREVIRGEVERLERVVDDTLCRALMSTQNRQKS